MHHSIKDIFSKILFFAYTCVKIKHKYEKENLLIHVDIWQKHPTIL